MHNVSTSLRVLNLLNIKLTIPSFHGAILPSLETLIVDNCGGHAGAAVACLARANSSLVNLSFLQCLHRYDIVEYDGTGVDQLGVTGLVQLPTAQLQYLHIADATHQNSHPCLVRAVRDMHRRGVFDELTSLRFSDSDMKVNATALVWEDDTSFIFPAGIVDSEEDASMHAWPSAQG